MSPSHAIDRIELQAITTLKADLIEALDTAHQELDPFNLDDYEDEEDYIQAFISFVNTEYKANKISTERKKQEQEEELNYCYRYGFPDDYEDYSDSE
jgi:hypothetical protein